MICINWMGFSFSFCPVLLSLHSSGLVPADIKLEDYDFDLVLGCHMSCLLSSQCVCPHDIS